MNEVEIIQGAREILSDPKRWTKHGWERGSRTCLEGALGVAACGNAYALMDQMGPSPELKAAEAVLLEHARSISYVLELSNFNDALDTTHQDILDLLDKTLASLGGLA